MKPDKTQSAADDDQCPFETPYRAWFFNPWPGTVAGYPAHGISAQSDALMRIRGYSRMFVKGTLRYYNDGEYDDKQDSISFYYDDGDTQTVKGYKAVDSFFVCCSDKIVLMCAGTAAAIDTTDVSGCNAMVFHPDNDTRQLYGKGTVKLSYYDQASSWIAAEELGIKILCRQSVVHYATMQKMNESDDQTEISTTVRYALDLVVKNIMVVSRYYNPGERTCTVWVACKKTDVNPQKGHSMGRTEVNSERTQ
jgi:hypothetical protein